VNKCGQTDEYTKDSSCLHTIYSLSKMAVVGETDKAVARYIVQIVLTQVADCRAAHRSSKKLFEQCQKLEKIWGHTFSCSITLTTPESWYRKVRELIDKQQSSPVWLSESKVRCEVTSTCCRHWLSC